MEVHRTIVPKDRHHESALEQKVLMSLATLNKLKLNWMTRPNDFFSKVTFCFSMVDTLKFIKCGVKKACMKGQRESGEESRATGGSGYHN